MTDRSVDGDAAISRVLLVGDESPADALADRLDDDGLAVVRARSPVRALATLDAAPVDCIVAVAGDGASDLFAVAQRRGHTVPGVFVGERLRTLPPNVEQAPPEPAAVARSVRQQLLATAAETAPPVTEGDADDPLAVFGSTVAHELRNHLSIAEISLEELDGDEESIERVTRAFERISGLAAEAEAVATGEVEATETVSLSSVADVAAERVPAEDATVQVRTDMTVRADRALLTLLFENVFRNAVEHAGADVVVTVEEIDGGFAIADDGPGFAHDDPFEWGATTGSGQGAGLGVVRRIVRAHGWSVRAVSEGGARIEVTV